MLLFNAVLLSAVLAQSSLDQRSPFGTNAPTNNSATPDRVPVSRPDEQAAPGSLPSTGRNDQGASTGDTGASSAPAQSDQNQPKSLAPDSTGTGTDTSATRSTTRSANTPQVIRPDQSVSPTPGSVTPGTQRTTSTPLRGASGAAGTVNTPGSNNGMPAPAQAPSSTGPIYPGASSGASSTQ